MLRIEFSLAGPHSLNCGSRSGCCHSAAGARPAPPRPFRKQPAGPANHVRIRRSRANHITPQPWPRSTPGQTALPFSCRALRQHSNPLSELGRHLPTAPRQPGDSATRPTARPSAVGAVPDRRPRAQVEFGRSCARHAAGITPLSAPAVRIAGQWAPACAAARRPKPPGPPKRG